MIKIRVPYFRVLSEVSAIYDPNELPEHVIVDYIECLTSEFDEDGNPIPPQYVLDHIKNRRFKYDK